MDSKQLQMFRQLLEQMKADVISDVEQTLSDMTRQSGNIPDPNDRATMESDRSFELRLRSRERKLLGKIDEAIARIEEGDYGICDECGEEIRLKRLEARPVAKFCINCKTKQEQREKEQGR
jgi:DnaK suppressor protein